MERLVVAETMPTPSCHAATVAVLDDGTEVVAWFGGRREGHADVAIWAARREQGVVWSEPVLAARARDVPCWNPVLHVTPDALLLFYKVGPSPQTWSGRVTRSVDGGATWGGRAPLPPGILGPIKNAPLQTKDGRLLCPSSTESHLAWGCWIEETDESLTTWRKHGPVHRDGIGTIQPALVVGDGGDDIVLLCRTANAGQVARAESADSGRTWSVPELIDVPHSNTGLDAIRLHDGRVVMVANAVPTGRTPLHVLVSDDVGRTFTVAATLEDGPGEYSYPSIARDLTADGELLVVATWQRTHIATYRIDPSTL